MQLIRENASRYLFLLLIALAGLASIFFLERGHRLEVSRENERELGDALAHTKDSFSDALEKRLMLVRHLHAFMLAQPTLPDEAAFNTFAAELMRTAPSVRALQYVGPDLTIHYVYPLSGNEAAFGLELMKSASAPYVEKALRERRLVLSDPVQIVQGPLAVVARAPLFRDDEFLGLVQAVVDVDPLLQDVAADVDPLFGLQAYGPGGDLIWGPRRFAAPSRQATVPAGDAQWTIALGWQGGPPDPDPLVLFLLWGLGGTLLLMFLFTVNRAWTRTERLEQAVAAKTAALSQSERQYRALFENTLDALVLADDDARYVDANPAACALLGYRREELLQKHVWDVTPSQDQEAGRATWRAFLDEGTLSGEYRLLRKDGSIVEVEFQAVAHMLPHLHLSSMRDIRARKRAEEGLRAVSFAAEQFLRSGDWETQIAVVLARLGQALDVSRVYIFENFTAAGSLRTSQRTEWTAPGVAPQIDNPELQEIDYAESGLGRWLSLLRQGEVLRGPVRALPPHEQEILAGQDIRSIVLVPIFVGETWWGLVGFDECRRERHWSEAEIDALRAAAETLGAAIQRKQSEGLIRRNVERAEALVRTAANLNKLDDYHAVLDTICEEAVRVLDVPAASINLYDEEQELFYPAASVGLPNGFEEQAFPHSHLVYHRYMEGLDSHYVVPDVQATPSTPNSAPYVEHDFRTLAFAELRYRDRLLGLLMVGTVGKRRDFTGGELTLLSGLAAQAAQAITNADLFASTQRLLQHTQQQAQQMQRIVDAVPEGVILLDAQRRIVLANPAAREHLATLTDAEVGDELAHLGGRPLAEVLPPTAEESPWIELQPGGSERIFELTERSIGNGAGGWVLIVRDVTEERQRQQYVQTQDRLATVGQLAAGIAHDFNNIMAIITLYSQSLERNPDLPRRADYLVTISKQARHAADLISQILDFSRRAVMERGKLDLLPFAKEVVKLLQRTLAENITITFEATPDTYFVSADPTRLQQSLMNLALNARDAMPVGGELRIDLDAFTLAPEQRPPLPGMAAGQWVRLDVADDGTGIAPQHLPHLFEPFFTTKQPGQGTGLGLAQVYGIVKQHGGEIKVESRLGEGTTFTIYLPALKAPASTTDGHGPVPALTPAEQETILLVEDHKPTRVAIRDTLEMLGYDVLVAETGRGALELFTRHRQKIDLVLSDMVMPEMGGVELYQQLVAQEPDVRLVVMTGYPLEDEGRSLLEQGIVDWIGKPFSPDAIARKLRKVLERSPVKEDNGHRR